MKNGGFPFGFPRNTQLHLDPCFFPAFLFLSPSREVRLGTGPTSAWPFPAGGFEGHVMLQADFHCRNLQKWLFLVETASKLQLLKGQSRDRRPTVDGQNSLRTS